MIQLRKVSMSDLDALILVNTPKGEENTEQWKNIHLKRIKESEENSDVEYFAATQEGKIVGHVLVRYSGGKKIKGYPYMEGLMVREDLRGRGIGSQIITGVEKIVKEKGYDKVGLACNNPGAQKLYESLRYKDLGNEAYVEGVYDGKEDWVRDMVKKLD